MLRYLRSLWPGANVQASGLLTKTISEIEGKGASDDAIRLAEELLLKQPDSIECLSLVAAIARTRGDLGRADALYARMSGLRPSDWNIAYKRANLLRERGDLLGAIAEYERTISINPEYSNALCNCGSVLESLGRHDEAMARLDRAIELNPNDPISHFNLGIVLRNLDRQGNALESFDRAIKLNPAYVEAISNRGVTLMELNRLDEALKCFDLCVDLKPNFCTAFFNRATLQAKRKWWTDAQQDYGRALACNPSYAEALCGRGAVRTVLGEQEEALVDIEAALRLKPQSPEALCARGNLRSAQGHSAWALHDYDSALNIDRDHLDALLGRALLHSRLRQFELAKRDYDRALALDPEVRFALGAQCHVRMNLCDWTDFSQNLRRLSGALVSGRALSPPFPIVTLFDDALLQVHASKIWVAEECPELPPPDFAISHTSGGKIRLAYFSADFYDHPVGKLIARVIELHDKAKFEVIGFSLRANPNDACQARIRAACDEFLDVSALSDSMIAELARVRGIHIAVDLGGFTAGSRTGVFAAHAAPLQVNFLGYPGTMGAAYMDYVVADHVLIPSDSRQFYDEKVVYMPHCYLPAPESQRISENDLSRRKFGLPEKGFVFCCFNNNYKILPQVFACWMSILENVSEAVLWLSCSNRIAFENLQAAASARGIDPARLVLAEHLRSHSEHIARYGLAQLFLDTLPYNAHATALDALLAGVPVLTQRGSSFAARVGASILETLGLPELIAVDEGEYMAKAIELACKPDALAEIACKLEASRENSPLWDIIGYTHRLEAAFTTMMLRRQKGVAADHIDVRALQAEL